MHARTIWDLTQGRAGHAQSPPPHHPEGGGSEGKRADEAKQVAEEGDCDLESPQQDHQHSTPNQGKRTCKHECMQAAHA